jgi:hypothetical protein
VRNALTDPNQFLGTSIVRPHCSYISSENIDVRFSIGTA